MEPLLSIIVAVAGAFGNQALEETTRRTIGELWEHAKQIIVTKFGAASLAPQLMDEMRRQPTMSAAEHVAAQLTALNVTNDPEVARVFRELAALAQGTSDDELSAMGIPQMRNAWAVDRRA
ncbi:hypothetical protein [Peristeroidobacter soli]|jgi:hypothetical protein|uniref:hypothetical protein n=1 Tax=Peristeroidobacter soli TaxID=2497877 RepID=UPI00101C635E|nr:hypothetical protein [Peristeroidobacter soli]